jgi:2-polyprenyl-6-methoxyphenol hydroxylase-like FAD-dependent oxidoreductase
MALEDGVVLADELARGDDLAATLTSFGERRLPRVKLVQDASRGILNGEMAVTAENIHETFDHWRQGLAGQMGYVEDFLNQPA